MSALSRLSVAGLKAQPGRTRLMVMAVALGVGAVGSITGAQTIIEREITRAFDATQPPDAEFAIAGDASEARNVALTQPGVEFATARSEYRLRLEADEGWQQVILIALDDPSTADVARAEPNDVDTEWPPPVGTVAVERASLSEVELAVGDTLALEGLGGDGAIIGGDLTVSGLAHDSGRTPAWLNGWVIAYAAPETLAELGLPTAPNRLLVTMDGADRAANQARADALVTVLADAGITARTLNVPVPGEHPSIGVMRTLLYLLQAFGIVAAVAAIGLLTALVVADVRRQRATIGIVKAQGADTGAIVRLFLRGVAVVASLGLVLAIPLGMLGAFGLTRFALTLLNLEVASWIAAPWVFAVQAAIALTVPFAAVLVPVWRLARIPARDALAVDASVASPRGVRTSIHPPFGRPAQLAWRNTVRQPGRLAVSVIALSLGAAASLSAFNTGAAWDRSVTEEFEAQNFAAQITFAQPVTVADALAQWDDGVVTEAWGMGSAVLATEYGLRGDNVKVLAPPRGWENPGYGMLDGRFMEYGASREAVLTQSVTDPSVAVGDHIVLGEDDEPWLVVGVIRQLSGGQDGSVYVNSRPSWMPGGSIATAVRILATPGGPSEAEAIDLATEAYASAGIPVAVMVTGSDAKESLDDHLYIITGLLLLLALVLGVVGLVALVESLTTSVLERRAEYAVMKAIGARVSAVTRIVSLEALAVAFMAWIVGLALAAPLTVGIERAVGTIFTGAGLPLTWWWPAAGIVFAAMLVTAAAASIVPGYDAADTPVREALAGE